MKKKVVAFFIIVVTLITIYLVSLVSLITTNCNKDLVYIIFDKGIFHEIHPFGRTKGFCGTIKNKLEDGYIHSIQYKEGKRNGVTEVFLENGKKVIQSHYKNNQLHGKYIAWDSRGHVRIKITYKNGTIDGIVQKWDKNGNIIVEHSTD